MTFGGGYHAIGSYGAGKGVCLSSGPCGECYRSTRRFVPLVSRPCRECGSAKGDALTVGCCEATPEDVAARRRCERCRAVAFDPIKVTDA